MCVDRDCGECKILTQANARRAHKGAQWVVLAAVLVLLLGHLAGVIESLVITVVCAGLLAIGAVLGYVWVLWRRLRGLPVIGRPQQVAGSVRQPVGQPQQQALSQGGPQLHLPANLSGDETIRVMRTLRGDR